MSPADVERAACELTERPSHILALEPNGLDDVWRDIARVADALGVAGAGAAAGAAAARARRRHRERGGRPGRRGRAWR